jgi:hypothetical protein
VAQLASRVRNTFSVVNLQKLMMGNFSVGGAGEGKIIAAKVANVAGPIYDYVNWISVVYWNEVCQANDSPSARLSCTDRRVEGRQQELLSGL